MKKILTFLSVSLLASAADDAFRPSVQQVLLRADACLNTAADDNAKKACLNAAYDGNRFERLVVLSFNLQKPTQALSDALAALTAARNDKQIGASNESSGSTSLAVKGYAPRLLALAVEHGAITQQVDKNIVTFRATPAGLFDALKKVELDQILGLIAPTTAAAGTPATAAVPSPLPPSQKLPEWTYNLSLSVGFDTNASGQANVLLANRKQIANFGARYILYNGRNAALRAYTSNWIRLANSASRDYTVETATLVSLLQTPGSKQDTIVKAGLASLQTGIDGLDSAALGKSRDDLLTEFQTRLIASVNSVAAGLRDQAPAVVARMQLKSLEPFFKGETELYTFVNKGALATIDYTVTRDSATPDLSTITFIAEGGLGKQRQIEWTINASGSYFNSTSTATTERFHSFKATGQLDVPLRSIADLGPFVLSLAGQFQHIPNTTVTPGTDVMQALMGSVTTQSVANATTPAPAGTGVVAVTPLGNVGVGQLKLTIPMKNTGVKVPFSFSISNRAGMIQEKTTFSATVGLTFDLDALFAKAAAKK